jgi:hypothetical protein
MRHNGRLSVFCRESKQPRRLRVIGEWFGDGEKFYDRRRSFALARSATRKVEQFIRDGFIRIDRAFFLGNWPSKAASLCGGTFHLMPMTRQREQNPVIRLRSYGVDLQRGGEHARTARCFDQFVEKWSRDGLGSFPVRFPHPDDPGNAGWHVDLTATIAIQTSSAIFPLGA